MAQFLLAVSGLMSLVAAAMLVFGLAASTSAPQEAAAAAVALAIAGIPYFIARAVSAAHLHDQMDALLNQRVQSGDRAPVKALSAEQDAPKADVKRSVRILLFVVVLAVFVVLGVMTINKAAGG